MIGLILLPADHQQFMVWAEVWPEITLIVYANDLIGKSRREVYEYINMRVLEN